jgi:hypothetical protein
VIALKPQIHGRTAHDIDRSGCPADKHGTPWYRWHHGCVCPDAVAFRSRYRKLQRCGMSPTIHVPIAGTARRLQALAVDGWDDPALVQLWDCPARQLRSWRGAEYRTIHRANAAFVATNYAALRDTPGGSSRMAQLAKARGWLSHSQLATFNIDDPVAGPLVRPFVPPGRVDLDEVQRQRKFGESEYQIAKSLGVEMCSIQDAERRKDGAA